LAVVTKVNADANDDDDAGDDDGDDDEGGGRMGMRVRVGMRRTPLPNHVPSEVGFMSRFKHRLWAYGIDG
jgi:hypothetical protein